jgi:hypothetical protein
MPTGAATRCFEGHGVPNPWSIFSAGSHANNQPRNTYQVNYDSKLLESLKR